MYGTMTRPRAMSKSDRFAVEFVKFLGKHREEFSDSPEEVCRALVKVLRGLSEISGYSGYEHALNMYELMIGSGGKDNEPKSKRELG